MKVISSLSLSRPGSKCIPRGRRRQEGGIYSVLPRVSEAGQLKCLMTIMKMEMNLLNTGYYQYILPSHPSRSSLYFPPRFFTLKYYSTLSCRGPSDAE